MDTKKNFIAISIGLLVAIVLGILALFGLRPAGTEGTLDQPSQSAPQGQ